MANGIEDLHEKNKNYNTNFFQNNFLRWNNFQGREDAEMLMEKSLPKNTGNSLSDYDDFFDE